MIDYFGKVIQYITDHQDTVSHLFVQHMQLCGTALGIAFLIAVPLGILISRFPVLYTPILGLLGAAYTIPSLAFFAILVPFVGLGAPNAVIALVVYAQFILVRNIVTGLRNVDPTIVEAARGMGMNPLQILWRVELPLALPVIVAGLRIATVTVIGVTTIATYISAGGLGDILSDGVQKILPLAQAEVGAGALASGLLAVLADLLLRLIENRAAHASGRAQTPRSLARATR